MLQRTDAPRINPADETIGTKGLTVRFLVTGSESNGSVVAFELAVAGSLRLPAPSKEKQSTSGRDRPSAFHAVPFIASTTMPARTRRHSA
jgi:hypothetical protein